MEEKEKSNLMISIFITHFFKCVYCKHWGGNPGDLWGHCPLKKGGTYWNSKAKTYFKYMTDTQRHSKCQKFIFSDEGYIRYITMVKEYINDPGSVL